MAVFNFGELDFVDEEGYQEFDGQFESMTNVLSSCVIYLDSNLPQETERQMEIMAIYLGAKLAYSADGKVSHVIGLDGCISTLAPPFTSCQNVTSLWLRQCFVKGSKLSEEDFLIGDATREGRDGGIVKLKPIPSEFSKEALSKKMRLSLSSKTPKRKLRDRQTMLRNGFGSDSSSYKYEVSSILFVAINYEDLALRSVTGIEGIYREHLGRLIKVFGGKFTESLTRRNTHVIAGDIAADSTKIKKAREWNIPVVSLDWLSQCAKAGCAVSHDAYTVGNMKRMTEELAFYNNRRTVENTPEQPKNNGGDFYIPKFDLGAASNYHTPSPANSPLNLKFTRNLELAVNRVTGTARPSEITNDEPFDMAKVDEMSSKMDPPGCHVLKKVMIAVSSKLQEKRSQISKLCRSLGATLLAGVSDNCTHFVHEGPRQNETFKDFKLAKRKGLHIVSPFWLEKCAETHRHLNEEDFPHTYNPSKSLKILALPLVSPLSRPGPAAEEMTQDDFQDDDGGFFDPSDMMLTSTLKTETKVKQEEPSRASPETAQTHEKDTPVEMELAEVKAEPKRRPNITKYVQAVNQLLVAKRVGLEQDPEELPSNAGNEEPNRNPSTSNPIWSFDDLDTATEITRSPVQEPQENYGGITYDDPIARSEKRKLLEQLHIGRISKRAKSIGEDSDKSSIPEIEKENLPHARSFSKEMQRIFITSGVQKKDHKKIISDRIEKLGGIFIDSEHWSPNCTHLIAEQFTRTEKCWAALASGTW
ncbi:DNA topoisomerase 2-binding protein 1 [Phlyctochytrium planicorne]|nr:DNA topoisomerase 2-binding protein 1 [Phlyctochytrium planicorne]